MKSHDLGRRSEEIACEFLQRRGWTILDRNYRAGHKEIDIVGVRGETVAFIEVKARTGRYYGHPSEAVTWRKRRELAQAARAWLRMHARPGHEYRFDAISIAWHGSSHVLEHVEDAWRIR